MNFLSLTLTTFFAICITVASSASGVSGGLELDNTDGHYDSHKEKVEEFDDYKVDELMETEQNYGPIDQLLLDYEPKARKNVSEILLNIAEHINSALPNITENNRELLGRIWNVFVYLLDLITKFFKKVAPTLIGLVYKGDKTE